jgi:hypothetical protein
MTIEWSRNKVGEYPDNLVLECFNMVTCSFCGKDLESGFHCSDNFIIPVFACDECRDEYVKWKYKQNRGVSKLSTIPQNDANKPIEQKSEWKDSR